MAKCERAVNNMLFDLRLTESEIKTLTFYLNQSLIDAEGCCAIGVGKPESVRNIKSILQKINTEKEKSNAEINMSVKVSLEDTIAVAKEVSKVQKMDNADKQIENER